MLNSVQKLIIDLHELQFCFMVPLPLQWNEDRSGLAFIPKKNRILSCCVVFALNILFTLGLCYSIVTRCLLYDHPNYNVGIAVAQALAGGGCLMAAYGSARFRLEWIAAFNEVLEKGRVLETKFRLNQRVQPLDWIGVAGVVAIWICAFIIFTAVLYFELDPFYCLSDDILDYYYGNRDERGRIGIVISFCTRAALELGAFGFAQFYSFVFGPILIFASIVNKYKILVDASIATGKPNLERKIRFYNQASILFKKGQRFMEEIMSPTVTAGFWVFVALSCLIFKGKDRIRSGFIYYIFVLAWTLGSVACLLLLDVLSMSMKRVEDFLQNLGEEAGKKSEKLGQSKKTVLSGAKLRPELGVRVVNKFEGLEFRKRLIRRSIKSLQPIRFIYRPFILVDKMFLVNVVNNCLVQSFSFMLIF